MKYLVDTLTFNLYKLENNKLYLRDLFSDEYTEFSCINSLTDLETFVKDFDLYKRNIKSSEFEPLHNHKLNTILDLYYEIKGLKC